MTELPERSTKVSIIIPTYNRAGRLEKCLLSLLNQDFPKQSYEIIIIDDGSTDNTQSVIQGYIKQLTEPEIHYEYMKQGGPGAARNLGINLAKADLIALTEDDVQCEKDWLKNALPYFADEQLGGLEGTTLLEGGDPLLRLPARGQGFIPCNIFYRRKIFHQVGFFDAEFFDENLNLYFREDGEFAFRVLNAGWKITRAENVIVYHPRLFQRSADLAKFVKRYYFDPLLYKKHPRQFREMIEVKKLGLFVLRRPLHILSLLNVISLLAMLILRFKPASISLILLLIYFLTIAGLIFKFTLPGFYLFKNEGIIGPLIQFVKIPFIYLYWFIKGCFRFKSVPLL